MTQKDTNLFREREQREGEIGTLDTVHGALVHQGAFPLGREQLPLLRMEGDVGVEAADQHRRDVIVRRADGAVEVYRGIREDLLGEVETD